MFEEKNYKNYLPDEKCNSITVKASKDYSLSDTLLCGQCFRYEEIYRDDEYCEYMVNAMDKLIFVGQKAPGEIIFYGVDSSEIESVWRSYFDLDTDYTEIGNSIKECFESDFLTNAIESACGIAILRQNPWETICSFIISQNNNIPRIRKIIRELSSAYGVNLALQNNLKSCPIDKTNEPISKEKCKACGRCFSFPKAQSIVENPELLLPSKPGFRYKYIVDAATKINSGEVDILKIKRMSSYDFTVSELTKILGVGLKVASCAALFGFYNLDAFPVDVWMKRAINEYFNGSLDHKRLGKYAGVAQQYIFHYIRNLSKE